MLGFGSVGSAPFGDVSGKSSLAPIPGHNPRASQLAIVAVSSLAVPAQASQFALVFPSADNAVASVGARFNQIAVVAVCSTIEVTVKPHGYLMRTPWAFPLLIQKGY